MLRPDLADPPRPSFVSASVRAGHTLVATIDQRDAAQAIAWAQELVLLGQAEEYALGATTLEDAYIRLTGRVSLDEIPGVPA
jgi:ABC-2 type transport system ATP-binding protein